LEVGRSPIFSVPVFPLVLSESFFRSRLLFTDIEIFVEGAIRCFDAKIAVQDKDRVDECLGP
jgi:hypothetical protein